MSYPVHKVITPLSQRFRGLLTVRAEQSWNLQKLLQRGLVDLSLLKRCWVCDFWKDSCISCLIASTVDLRKSFILGFLFNALLLKFLKKWKVWVGRNKLRLGWLWQSVCTVLDDFESLLSNFSRLISHIYFLGFLPLCPLANQTLSLRFALGGHWLLLVKSILLHPWQGLRLSLFCGEWLLCLPDPCLRCLKHLSISEQTRESLEHFLSLLPSQMHPRDHREKSVKTVGELLLLRFFRPVTQLKQRLLWVLHIEHQWEPRSRAILLPDLEFRNHLNFLEFLNSVALLLVNAGSRGSWLEQKSLQVSRWSLQTAIPRIATKVTRKWLFVHSVDVLKWVYNE